MANPANAVARWEKTGIHISLCDAITESETGAAFEHQLRDSTMMLFPQPAKSVNEWDISATGKPMPEDENFTLGLARPNFTIETPVTVQTLALLFSSLMQGEGYNAGSHYQIPLYTSSAATQFMHLESGSTGHFFQSLGTVVRSLTLSIPIVDDSGGRPMLRAECIGANGSRLAALSKTAATADANTKQLSSNFYLKLDDVAKKMISAEITMTTNAERSPNVGATPDAIFLGKYEATGNLTVLFTSSSSDEFDALMDAHEAKTIVDLELGVTSLLVLVHDVVLEAPTINEQGGVLTAQFPFRSVYVDANSFSCRVDSATDILEWAEA